MVQLNAHEFLTILQSECACRKKKVAAFEKPQLVIFRLVWDFGGATF
jgi:hypothetical protein